MVYKYVLFMKKSFDHFIFKFFFEQIIFKIDQDTSFLDTNKKNIHQHNL